jgi:hypothetical protein
MDMMKTPGSSEKAHFNPALRGRPAREAYSARKRASYAR